MTVGFKELERAGRYQAIIKSFDSSLPQTQREMVALARAKSFISPLTEAEESLSQLDPKNLDTDSRIVFHLAEASILRRKNLWQKSHFRALRALSLCPRLSASEKELQADALFAVALSLTELRRPYLALDCYQRIRKMKTASDYRKSLAAANEAMIMWDVGRWKMPAELKAMMSENFLPRATLMLNLVNLDHAKAIQIIPHLASEIQPREKKQIALLLCEFAFLNENVRRALLHFPHVEIHFNQFDQEANSNFFTLVLQSLRSRQGISLENFTSHSQMEKTDWRTQVEQLFLLSLSHMAENPSKAFEIYKNYVDPLLTENEISTILMPRVQDLGFAVTPWNQKLAQLFYVPLEGANDSAEIHNTCLILHLPMGTSILNFDKKPQSLLALKAIAGNSGQEFSKRQIHQFLTGNAYSPRLHDDRIQKLYKRLELEIYEACGQKLWTWPGTNCLKLQMNIELHED